MSQNYFNKDFTKYGPKFSFMDNIEKISSKNSQQTIYPSTAGSKSKKSENTTNEPSVKKAKIIWFNPPPGVKEVIEEREKGKTKEREKILVPATAPKIFPMSYWKLKTRVLDLHIYKTWDKNENKNEESNHQNHGLEVPELDLEDDQSPKKSVSQQVTDVLCKMSILSNKKNSIEDERMHSLTTVNNNKLPFPKLFNSIFLSKNENQLHENKQKEKRHSLNLELELYK